MDETLGPVRVCILCSALPFRSSSVASARLEASRVHLISSFRALHFVVLSSPAMPVRHLLEVVPPDPVRYIIGAAIMMLGVVLPVGYMMFRTKRVPTSSVYAKQMDYPERQRGI